MLAQSMVERGTVDTLGDIASDVGRALVVWIQSIGSAELLIGGAFACICAAFLLRRR